jgi:hypothetical protein
MKKIQSAIWRDRSDLMNLKTINFRPRHPDLNLFFNPHERPFKLLSS